MAHILIIDDYPDTRDVTRLILADAGHTVSSATDGIRGLYLEPIRITQQHEMR